MTVNPTKRTIYRKASVNAVNNRLNLYVDQKLVSDKAARSAAEVEERRNLIRLSSIKLCLDSLMKHKLEYKPPWFTLQVIGIAGASASGKTSVAKALVKKLNVPSVTQMHEYID